ncbi:ribbon-helix-helix protein, CopG family [Desulfofundulus thermobenzoicus]|uniref:Ribbon-helix-helix protein, CopG family n=1 Tax=Desulfofundulus thermobenzoicus TaxID=29376 RepID=A0A6N7IRQ7_9FIRM|nr:ribbon-helix-helix protein, CopG family [Desulfofundulus thermobenzoicus]MQL52601.1 ribbon-helix-helix protein, CopG family [Desulfofundulus thermobenzoicus]HHW44131.1 ribbon-helix-helix protein, CopG family [Desulfotomaculum sp.]
MAVAQVKRIMISLPDNLLAEVDGIVAAERLNRSELIREAMRLYIAERKRRQLREQMKKGYLEMASINLALAVEQYRLEAEVVRQYERAEVK